MIKQTRKGESVLVEIDSNVPIFDITWSIQKGDVVTIQPSPGLMSANVYGFSEDEFIQVNVSGFKTQQKTLPFNQTFTIVVNSEPIQLR